MKKLVFFFAAGLFLVYNSYAGNKPLKDFNELMGALNGGYNVSVVIHYAKCQLEIDGEIQENSPDAIGGMEIDVYEYFAPMTVYNKLAFVVTSKSKLIQNPIGDGYVYNYVKLKIYEDDSVIIIAQYIDPLTYKVIMDEKFIGMINNGKSNAGVFLYRLK